MDQESKGRGLLALLIKEYSMFGAKRDNPSPGLFVYPPVPGCVLVAYLYTSVFVEVGFKSSVIWKLRIILDLLNGFSTIQSFTRAV